jgi:hypothetical protein
LKTISAFPLRVLFPALPLAALWLSGCAKEAAPAPEPSPPTPVDAAAVVGATASDSWDHIKDVRYEQRSDFVAGLNRMTRVLDANMGNMSARFTSLTGAAARNRDAAKRELDEARTELKAALADLGDTSATTWDDAKAKVARAWQRVQVAYAKLAAVAGP